MRLRAVVLAALLLMGGRAFAGPAEVASELARIVGLPAAERVSAQAALAARGAGVVSTLGLLAQERTLADEQAQVAMFVLGEIGSLEACAALPNEAALDRRSAAVGLAAAVARARCGSSAALQLRLDSVDARVRAKAAVTLGIVGYAGSLVKVVAASSDPVNGGYVTFWALARGLMGDGSVASVLEVLERQPATARLAWLARMRSSPLGPAEEWQPNWLEESDPMTGEALVREYLRRCEVLAPEVRAAASAKWPRLAPALAKGCGVGSP